MNFKKVLSLLLALTMIASIFTCTVVKAETPAGYIVYEEYGEGDIGGWQNTGTAVTNELTGAGNYAMSYYANTTGLSLNTYTFDSSQDILLEAGKNMVIETRILADTTTQRVYFGMNHNYTNNPNGNGNGSVFLLWPEEGTVSNAQSTFNRISVDGGVNRRWFNIKLTLLEDTGKGNLLVTLDDGTVIYDVQDKYFPANTDAQTPTDLDHDVLNTLSIGPWRGESTVYVDYLKVYKTTNSVTAYLPEANSGKNKIEVKFSEDNAAFVNFVDFYQADGVTPLSGNKEYDAANKKVEFTPSSTLAKGSNVVVKLNENAAVANGYDFTNIQKQKTVAIRTYIVNDDYSATDTGSWSIPFGSGSVAYEEVDGAGTAAVTVNNSSSYAEMLVNGGVGVTFEEGKNVVLEMRTKRSTAATRLDTKINMGEIEAFPFYTSNTAKTEWQDVVYGLFRQNNDSTNLTYFDAGINTVSDFSDTGATDWITTKIVFKGKSGNADISFTKTLTSTGEPLTVTFTDKKMPRAGTVGGTYKDGFALFDSLNSLSFRIIGNGGAATSAATTNYYDYVRVYEVEDITATAPSTVKPKGNVDVVFDKDVAGLENAVKLYNEAGTQEISAVNSYNEGTKTVTINPDSDLTEGTNYKVIIDKDAFVNGGFIIDNNEFTVKATKYIVNEDYSEGNTGGWGTQGTAVTDTFTGTGNYAVKFSAANPTNAGLSAKLYDVEDIALEEGKNVVIETRILASSTDGRLYFGMNYGDAGNVDGTGNGALFALWPAAGNYSSGSNVWSQVAVDGGTNERWFNVKVTLLENTGNGRLHVTLDDGTVIVDNLEGKFPAAISVSALKTICIAPWRGTVSAYVDYLRVYDDIPTTDITATVPSSVLYNGNIDVTFSHDITDALKGAVKLYNADGTQEIETTNTYNASTKTVTVNPDTDLTIGTNYKVKFDEDILLEGMFSITGTKEFTVNATRYLVNENYANGDFGGWKVGAGTGTISTFTRDDVTGAGNYAMNFYAANESTYAVYNFNNGEGIAYEEGKNIVIETRTRYDNSSSRYYLKMNMPASAFGGANENGSNYYTVWYYNSNGSIYTGENIYGTANSTLGVGTQWFETRLVLKGTSNLADLTISNGTDVIEKKDIYLPCNGNPSSLGSATKLDNLVLRERSAATNIMVDYLRVYKEAPVTATVPSSVKPEENITVTFDTDDSGLKDAVKLYNADKTQEISATYTYNASAKTVTIDPTLDLTAEANYTVVIDENALANLGYGMVAYEFVVKASNYLVYEDYSATNSGGWKNVYGTAGTVTTKLIEGTNYAAQLNIPTISSAIGYEFNNGEGYTFKEGKNLIAEIRFARSHPSGVLGRAELKMNVGEPVPVNGTATTWGSTVERNNISNLIWWANESSTHRVTFKTGQQTAYTYTEGGYVTLKITFKGTSGLSDVVLTGTDGTEYTYTDVSLPWFGNNSFGTTGAYDSLKTFAFRVQGAGGGANGTTGTTEIYVDYLRVHEEIDLAKVTASVASSVKYTDNIRVTFDKANAEFKDAVKLYNAEGTDEIKSVITIDSNVVTINPNTDLTKGETYKVVIDKKALEELGYSLTNATNVFNVLAHNYIIYEDYSYDAGEWTIAAGSGTATQTTVDGAGVAALTLNSNATHMYHAVNGGTGITFEDGKDVILETRVRRADIAARLMFKMNVGETLPDGNAYAFGTTEQTNNLYSLFYMTTSSPYLNLGNSMYGAGVKVDSTTDLLSGAGEWLNVKIIFKGATGKADVTFSDDDENVVTFTDKYIPVANTSSEADAGFDAMKSLSFRTTGTGAYSQSAGSTTVYLDYLKVYDATSVSATVPSTVKPAEDIKVVFDKDNAGLKDTVKLYDAAGTQEIEATYTYTASTKTVTINPESDLTEGLSYTVKFDETALADLGYAFLGNTSVIVNATKYIVNEDYADGDRGGWEGGTAVTNELTGSGNYAVNWTASTSAISAVKRTFNGSDGIKYEDGKNLVIETRILGSSVNADGRIYYGLNYGKANSPNSAGNGALFIIWPTGVVNGQSTYDTPLAVNNGPYNVWYNVKTTLIGTTGKANLLVTLDDGTVVYDVKDKYFPANNGASTPTDAGHDALYDIAVASWRGSGENTALVDYLRVYNGYPLDVVMAEKMEPGKTLKVQLNGAPDESIAQYVELYDSTGTNKIETVNTFDAQTDTVTLTYETGFANGETYVVKINKAVLGNLGYLVDSIADSYPLEVSNFIIDDDFEDGSFNGWALYNANGHINVMDIEENDGQTKALVFSDTTDTDDTQVAIRNFATPIAPRHGQNIVLETRIKHTKDAARSYLKVNIKNIGPGVELGGNNYTLFLLANQRDGFAHVSYPAGIAKNATNNVTIKPAYDIAEASNTNTWFHVKALFDGTNQATLTITNEATGEEQTVTADFDSWDAVAADYSTLTNVALRSRTAADDVYLDYLRIYYEDKETTPSACAITIVDADGNEATSVSSGNTYYTHYEFDGYGADAAKDTTVIFALYKDGDLVQVIYEELKSRKNHNRMTDGLAVPTDGGSYELKAFLWNTIEGMVPYVDTVSATGNDFLTVFVDANGGKDTNNGSAKAPVATIARANSIINTARNNNPEIQGAEVVISGGDYYISGPILASGENYNNVTYRAKSGETPEIIGGKSFLVSDAVKVTDQSILNRVIDQTARNNLYQYDLGALLGGKENILKMGLYGTYSFEFGLSSLINGAQGENTHELFYDDGTNDTVMTLSRYPNEGHADPNDDYMRISTVNNEGTVYKDYTSGTVTPFSITPADTSRLASWATADQAAMFGYWYYDWATQSVMIDDIDPATGVIKSKYPSAYGVLQNQKFYIYNLLEEIDMVNEYFIDRNTGILYFYKSPNAKATDKINISTLSAHPLMQINNADNVKIKDLTFKNGIYSGVRLIDCTNSVIENCDISNIARTSVVINGGNNNKIEGCYIHDVNGGITLAGGDKDTLTSANNVAINNEIENFSRLNKAYAPAITLQGVGNIATHNEIHDSEHNAIMFSGNEHEISYNDIYDVCQQSSDVGAIYAGRSWVSRGTEVKFNYIHDIASAFTENDSYESGIFLDDTFAGTTIYGNILADMADIGIQINGGRDNTIDKNIFVNCNEAINWQGMPSDFSNHYAGLESVPYTSNVWKTKYQELYNAVAKYTIESPENNVYTNNVYFNIANGLGYVNENLNSWINSKKGVEAGGNITASSSNIFENYANKNYQLKENCEVYTQINEFPVIDFASIGIIK